MPEVHRLHQIGPLLGRWHFVGGHVTGVPHQAIASQGLAEVEVVGRVDGVSADFGGRSLVGQVANGLEQFEARQHLKRIGCRGPEHIRSLAHRQLTDIGNALHGVLVQDFDLDAGIGFLKSGFVGLRQLFGKRGHHRHGAGLRSLHAPSRQCQQGAT